ncbi:uncharacterized protein [Diadema antillarum]|uniref:uncharacterized protein n=1 Tax=Diadema antillarum TaxID=105358 RepID=UPI003A8AE3A7
MAVFKSLVVLCLVFVSSQAACPDDSPYIEGPTGHCYRVVSTSTQGSSWQAARSLCADTVGSDLVVIDDQDELDWLIKVMSAEGVPDSSWWIGYSDISREDDWRWTDCQATTEWHRALWASGNLGNGDCGVLRMDGKIGRTACETQISTFVCEITPKAFALESLTADSLTVTSLSTTSLEVTWSMPTYSCDVVGYRVYYAAADSPEDKKSVSVNSGNARSTVIHDLHPSTTYKVSVALYTSMDTELQETAPVEVVTDTCPDGYELGPNGHCYWFYETTYGNTWHYARIYCMENDDSDLLIIDDEEELEFVLNKTSMMNTSSSRDWWIGYSDTSVAGDWRWTDCNTSTSWQTDLWEPGQPSEQTRCGFLTGNGTIMTAECDTKHHSICEIQPREIEMGGDTTSAVVGNLLANQTYNVTVVALVIVDEELTEVGPVQVTTDPCPANYELGPNGHCYWFYESTYGDMWHYARRDCVQDTDSDLLNIDDEEELEYILTRTSTMNTSSTRDWWIGFSDSSVAGDWRWTDCDASTSWQMDLWEPGPPAEERRGCGALTANGTIRADVCDAKHHFICEIQPRGFDWYDQNVRDVSAVPVMYGATVSWTNAETNCDVYGYRIEYRENVQDSDSLFSIAFGGNVTSALVSDLRPNRTYSMTVAALLTVDLELSQVGPAIVTTPPCPAEYDYEEGPSGHCYRFRILDDGTRWQRGRQTCDNVVDSDYVIINDEEELRYLVNRSAEVDPEMSWWIGLSDLSVPADWRWIDCTSPGTWQEGLWAPGYPTRLDVGTCAALQPSGDVVDLHCDTRLSYICELLAKGSVQTNQVPKP